MMNDKSIKSLLVEDNPGDARLIREMLTEERNILFDLECVDRLSTGLEYLAARDIDVVMLDLSLPDSWGFDTFTKVHNQATEVPIIVLTSLDDELLALRAVREGAQDYLVKSQIDSNLLVRAIRYAIERKEIDRMKSELISTVSHELKSPLTSILGSLSLIVSDEADNLPIETKKMIDIAYRNSQRLLRLINNMLDIKKIEFGKMNLHLQPLELTPLVTRAIEANRAYAKQLDVEFVLKEISSGVSVNADSDYLMQVLTNLLSNAARFSPPNDAVVISIAESPAAREAVRVAVTDHGPGVPKQFHSRIFQKFAQARPPGARRKDGTGLGLSIAKAIVESMGGQIGFDTEPNVETTFYFDLPEYHCRVADCEETEGNRAPLTGQL